MYTYIGKTIREYCCVCMRVWFNFKFNRNGESTLELSKEVYVYIFKQIYG